MCSIDDIFPTQVRERIEKEATKEKEDQDKAAAKAAAPHALEKPPSVGDTTWRNLAESAGPGKNPLLGVIADAYPNTTILFSDIVSFTDWSATVQPERVFSTLEVLFGKFDELAKKNGVYKARERRARGAVRVAPNSRASLALSLYFFLLIKLPLPFSTLFSVTLC